jgi:hypothetical protein
VARGLHPYMIGDTPSQPSACRQANDLYEVKQTPRDSCQGVNKGRQAFHKDLSGTIGRITKAFAHLYHEANVLPAHRQICHCADVAAMDPPCMSATEWASGVSLCRNDRECESFATPLHLCDF